MIVVRIDSLCECGNDDKEDDGNQRDKREIVNPKALIMVSD